MADVLIVFAVRYFACCCFWQKQLEYTWVNVTLKFNHPKMPHTRKKNPNEHCLHLSLISQSVFSVMVFTGCGSFRITHLFIYDKYTCSNSCMTHIVLETHWGHCPGRLHTVILNGHSKWKVEHIHMFPALPPSMQLHAKVAGKMVPR